jgi:GntR family transcriptional regulator, transcriptional repressor for pyruvate dehydrogenase complex
VFPGLNRLTLAEQVSMALAEHIEQQGLKPGDRLPTESRLAAEFGVSRPVIREGLRILAGQGAIDLANGRTPTVKPVSGQALLSFFRRAVSLDERHLTELLEVRRGIEVESARLAAERRTDEDLAAIEVLLSVMQRDLLEPELYAEHDLELHLRIASAAHNSLVYHLVESIRSCLRETIREGLRRRRSRRDFERIQAAHVGIAQAVRSGDPRAASEAMADHFDRAIAALRLGASPGGSR